jgi:hypothetical protein
MINRGVFSYRGSGGSLCTKYNEDDLIHTEAAIDHAFDTLQINHFVGSLS